MALRLFLPLLLLLLLARAAGALECHQCTAEICGVCQTSATTCATTGRQLCGSAKFSLGELALFTQHDCVSPEFCEHNDSALVPGLRLERSCCDTTLCNGGLPRAPAALPPALALGVLLALGQPLL